VGEIGVLVGVGEIGVSVGVGEIGVSVGVGDTKVFVGVGEPGVLVCVNVSGDIGFFVDVPVRMVVPGGQLDFRVGVGVVVVANVGVSVAGGNGSLITYRSSGLKFLGLNRSA
jgi:hypothetical protein